MFPLFFRLKSIWTQTRLGIQYWPLQILEEFTPGLRYRAWGEAGIFFPDRNIPIKSKLPHVKWKFDVGTDKDFELIKEATKDMQTEFEISLWFCRDGRDKHTVFDRERSHVYLANPPQTILNSWSACQTWMKKMEYDIKYWDAGNRFGWWWSGMRVERLMAVSVVQYFCWYLLSQFVYRSVGD